MKPIERHLDSAIRQACIKRECRPNGVFNCFVCGIPEHYHHGEVGHFMGRANMATRWDLMNCHMICIKCNRFDNEHFDRYKAKMIEFYGETEVNLLIRKARSAAKFFDWELRELLESIKNTRFQAENTY